MSFTRTLNFSKTIEKRDSKKGKNCSALVSAYLTGDGRLIEKYSSDEVLNSVIKAHPNMANIFKLRNIELPELR